MDSSWKCPKCGYLNSGKVGGVILDPGSFSEDISQLAKAARICSSCGAENPFASQLYPDAKSNYIPLKHKITWNIQTIIGVIGFMILSVGCVMTFIFLDDAINHVEYQGISLAIGAVVLGLVLFLVAFIIITNSIKSAQHGAVATQKLVAVPKTVSKKINLANVMRQPNKSRHRSHKSTITERPYASIKQHSTNPISIVTCPKCKARVIPKYDGTCPSCQAKISE